MHEASLMRIWQTDPRCGEKKEEEDPHRITIEQGNLWCAKPHTRGFDRQT